MSVHRLEQELKRRMSDFSVSAKFPTITQLLLPKSVTVLNDPNHPEIRGYLLKNQIYMSDMINRKKSKKKIEI